MNLNTSLLFAFNEFEHAIRLICKQYDYDLYVDQENSINAMCKGIMKRLGCRNKRDSFIDLITYLRNSSHNNGLFVPRRKKGGKILSDDELKDRNIMWNDTIFYFKKDQRIKDSKGDLWLSLVPIIKEILMMFNEIIYSERVHRITYIIDPSEPNK